MINFKNTSENYTSLFLCMCWGAPLMDWVKAIAIRLLGANAISLSVVPFLYIVVFLASWKYFSKSIKGTGVIFYFICLLIYVVTYIIFPQNANYLDEYFAVFLLSSVPFVFVGSAIDIEKLYKPFYIISLLCVLTIFINTVFLERNERAAEDYSSDMQAAYIVLPHILFVLNHLFHKFNVVDLITSLLGGYLLFGMGTRGTLICAGAFIAMYPLLFGSIKHKVWVSAIILAIVFLVYTYIDSIFEFMGLGMEQANMSSRIVDAYVRGEITDDSGRSWIHEMILNRLSGDHVFGFGLCGDRVVSSGYYSHNIVIELWASFGYFLGSCVFLALFFYIFRAWRRCSLIEKEFLLVLICYLLHFFVSGTFLNAPLLFLTIGWCSRIIQTRKQNIHLSVV